MKKKKIIVLTMYCPFPANYGGKVGTLSILNLLNKYFDVYLFGLLEKDDVIDKEKLSLICKYYSFYPRKKTIGQYLLSPFSPFLLQTRMDKKMVKDISLCIENEHIDFLFVDTFLMFMNIGKIKGNIPCFVNEQNIEYLSLLSNGNARKFPFNLFYKYQSYLLRKKEIKMMKNPKVNGITFASFDDQNKYCEITGCEKGKTLYLPPVYSSRSVTCSQNKTVSVDALIVGNFKYPANVYGLNWFIDNCLPIIEKERPNIKVAIIGRGLFDSFNKEELSKKACLNPIGEVDEVSPYYNGTKVVMIPLFHGGGVKIKLLEAVSYHKFIVCTSKATEGTRFDKDSLFVSDDPKEFVNMMFDAIDDEAIRNLKVEKADSILKSDFDEEAVSKRLYDFITKKGNI